MDTHDPELITVVMPCFNAAPYVEEAVASVRAQTYPRIELIVTDDGSTDGSADILQRLANAHPGTITLLYQNRAGPFVARNLALAHAQGDCIAFLDADDTWHPEALERLHGALTAERADLAYCGWKHIGVASTEPPPPALRAMQADEALTLFVERNLWTLNSVLVRRHLLDTLHGFSEHAPTAMDDDLWLRMLALKPRLAHVPDVLAHYRRYPRGPAQIPHWRQVFDAVAVRQDFVHRHPECVSQFAPGRLHELLYAPLLREAYRCHWRNDTESARRLFRRALRKTEWQASDLKHLLASLLPAPLYRSLVDRVTRRRGVRRWAE